MVKAMRAGRWGKVKALQRLLTHSFSGKAVAVKRVTENRGKRTAGVDGVIWETPQKKGQAVQSLRQHGYRAQSLRRVYIPKGSDPTRKRGLNIPTMRDRAMQSLYKMALDPIAETRADPNSYGFRTGRSTADAIEQCFTVLSRKGAAQWILDADIRACFDEISHDWLLGHIPMDKDILHQWLKAGYLDQQAYHQTQAGTAQGGTISPVLANYTLDGLERQLKKRFAKSAKVHLCRYADDIIITGTSKELLENEVQPLVTQFLQDRGLLLSAGKTKIVHIKDGFDFLGQNIRKYQDKLLIKPAQKNVQVFLDKVRRLIKANGQATAGRLIMELNPLIRGWATYHRHVVSKATFSKVDHQIHQALWRWAKRRHPRKSLRWIKDKYFHTLGERHWVFCGLRPGQTTTSPKLIYLFCTAKMPIKRHIKVKGLANPYDPQWEEYFERRLDIKMKNELKGNRKLLHLWLTQAGQCPICTQKITQETGWQTHHIRWRTNGGDDSPLNLLMLHPNCHRQVHNRNLTVAKPRPQGVRMA
jgi:RNA-directed DNA polymerase